MFYASGLPRWMRCVRYPAPFQAPASEWEKQALKNEAEALQAEMDAIKKRLSDIEAGTAGN